MKRYKAYPINQKTRRKLCIEMALFYNHKILEYNEGQKRQHIEWRTRFDSKF